MLLEPAPRSPRIRTSPIARLGTSTKPTIVPSGDDDAEQLASGSAESQVSPTVVDPGTTVTETPAGDPISVQACGDTPAAVHPTERTAPTAAVASTPVRRHRDTPPW